MERIGKYFGRQVFWLDYENYTDQLPDNNWVCLAIANKQPNLHIFDNFVRTSISKNILEFKGCGQFGEKLHHLFDLTMAIMETDENHSFIEVMTTSHNDETIADVFWQCFFATCFPNTADFDAIIIVCTDLDNVNRIKELTHYIKEFEQGWLPSENLKHEVWEDPEGLTSLCLADETGDDFRKLSEQGSKLIHTFYASSHFEAMTIYYEYMGWSVKHHSKTTESQRFDIEICKFVNNLIQKNMFNAIEIDRNKLTIMGVKFSDLKTLESTANALGSNMFEGYKPTPKGIEIIRDYVTGKISLTELVAFAKQKAYV